MTTLHAKPSTLRPPDRVTRRLLGCGAIGAPLFVIVFLVEGAVRQDYRPLRDQVSGLAIGQRGWVQIANFIICGVLMLALAVGLRRALRPGTVAVVAPVLAGLYALGLIASGVFVTDPRDGYPPTSPSGQAAAHTWHGDAHNVAGTVVFLALPVLCFVVAAWFTRRSRQWLWAAYSVATGVAMLALIQGLAVEDHGGLYQRLTIVAGWGWLTALALHLRRRATTAPAEVLAHLPGT
ncbi:DUF998 domain-containing protein [Micromonospora sp. NPDC093277]|uniref:DUF998 domain-containing protein n=1 Tax=Micromonospora sp. NPDC093277 TaxID=3364291 RepID=UPI00382CC833